MADCSARGAYCLGSSPKLLEALLEQAYLVVVVINDEFGVDADGLAVAPQNAGADGVKGAQRQVFDLPADQLVEPLLHLPGGFIGEGDRHDAVGADADRP